MVRVWDVATDPKAGDSLYLWLRLLLSLRKSEPNSLFKA